MKRVLAVTVLLVLSGCLGTAATTSTQNGTGSLSAQTVNTTALEQKIHAEVNEERTKRGLDSLDWDDELRAVAAYHSENMVKTGYVAHTSPSDETVEDRYERFNIDCTGKFSSGENIAKTLAEGRVQMPTEVVNYEYNESRIAQGVVAGWLNSPGHKENLLRSAWSAEGIGVAYNEENKTVFVTQNFC